MRRTGLVPLLVGALLCAAPAANAAVTPKLKISPRHGRAPLTSTFDASRSKSTQPGGITSFAWTFGDGSTAMGPVVQHTYAVPGDFVVTLTVTDAGGATATRTSSAHSTGAGGLTLAVPKVPTPYGVGVPVHGQLSPPLPGAGVRLEGLAGRRWITLTVARTDAQGRFRAALRARGPARIRARWTGVAGPLHGALSPEAAVAVRARVQIVRRSAVVYGSLQLAGRVEPARPRGRVRLEVRRGGQVVGRRTLVLDRGGRFSATLPAARPGTYSALAQFAGDAAFGPAFAATRVQATLPSLSAGASGPAVAALRRRLTELGFRQATSAPSFDADLVDAVLAFQKLRGLERTAVVTPPVWSALATGEAANLRFPDHGDHLEVDKRRQVLLIALGGSVTVLPVSTAGVPGASTPEGSFAVQRKVPGFDPSPLGVLYDPLYFTGGYAVHGNPSVPAYPASHGCIRVPMWAASWIYATFGVGTPVDVYS